MSKPMQPLEIARETLRRLAMNKTPPTPDNYRTLYHEITGSKVVEPFPEKALKTVHAELPRDTPEQTRFARQFEAAIASGNWRDSMATANAHQLSISIHSSSEPSCPPQTAATRYWMGSSELECCAT